METGVGHQSDKPHCRQTLTFSTLELLSRVLCFIFQIIICTFCPFLIFPLIYFVPDEHHEREAAARRTQKSLTSKSMKNVRRASKTGDGVELQNIQSVNGNPKPSTDEEATVGSDGEDVVDFIPGNRALVRNTVEALISGQLGNSKKWS